MLKTCHNFEYFTIKYLVINYGLLQRPEWPSPHDCTSSVWDELMFIPIIGSTASIEVGSILFFFPHLLQGYPLKKSILLPKHFKPLLPTSTPSITLNLAITQEKKQCCRRWCYKSYVELLLQKTMLHRCVEAMLQEWCWSGVAEDVVKVVLLKTLLKWCYRKRSSKKY